MPPPLPSYEAAILSRLALPDKPRLSASAAKALLKLNFSQTDQDSMRSLAAKARAGDLSVEEQAQIDAYSRISSLLGVLKSRARRSLARPATNGSPKTP